MALFTTTETIRPPTLRLPRTGFNMPFVVGYLSPSIYPSI